MKEKKDPEKDSPGQKMAFPLASLIRQESGAGRLVSGPEILNHLTDCHGFSPRAGEFGILMRETMEEQTDLRELVAEDGSRHYYSELSMTGAYAWMLLGKKGNPLRLIAEIVRKDSAHYPRPVPLDLFMRPPFAFTRGALLACLERIAEEGAYPDIARTVTSASGVYLYSTLFLGHEHAAMLAEWLDVDMADNP